MFILWGVERCGCCLCHCEDEGYDEVGVVLGLYSRSWGGRYESSVYNSLLRGLRCMGIERVVRMEDVSI